MPETIEQIATAAIAQAAEVVRGAVAEGEVLNENAVGRSHFLRATDAGGVLLWRVELKYEPYVGYPYGHPDRIHIYPDGGKCRYFPATQNGTAFNTAGIVKAALTAVETSRRELAAKAQEKATLDAASHQFAETCERHGLRVVGNGKWALREVTAWRGYGETLAGVVQLPPPGCPVPGKARLEYRGLTMAELDEVLAYLTGGDHAEKAAEWEARPAPGFAALIHQAVAEEADHAE